MRGIKPTPPLIIISLSLLKIIAELMTKTKIQPILMEYILKLPFQFENFLISLHPLFPFTPLNRTLPLAG